MTIFLELILNNHYGKEYFAWQSSIGEFGGWANLSKFSPFISKNDDVLDFGCGGGYLLKELSCRSRTGVEVNESAVKVAINNGIKVYKSVNDVPDNSVDVLISNNALEHVYQPFDEIKALYSKLRKGGKVIFVVPCESISYVYKEEDINCHLYSWSPMCAGNLFTQAGFKVLESKPYMHKWPPNYRFIAGLGGRRLFDLVCRIYGRVERSWFQVRVIAQKG